MLTYTLNLGQVEKLKVLQLNLNNDVVIHAFVNDFSEAKVFNKKIREYI